MIKDFLKLPKLDQKKYWSNHWEKHNLKNEKIKKSIEWKYLIKLARQTRSKILDVGCGNGSWVFALRKAGFKCFGSELASKHVTKLNRIACGKIFFREDIRKPFIKYKYDLIFSWGAFEHFEDGPKLCLQGCFKKLKPNGILIFSVPYVNFRILCEKYFTQKNSAPCKMSFYQYRFSKNEIIQEVANIGFSNIHVTPIHSYEGLKRFLHYHNFAEYNRFFNKLIARLLDPIIGRFFCHMILVKAYKNEK